MTRRVLASQPVDFTPMVQDAVEFPNWASGDWTKGGLVTFYLLFVMELKTRRVHFAGCTTNPHEAWMKQIARELTNCEDGFMNDKCYLLMDRDGKFCQASETLSTPKV